MNKIKNIIFDLGGVLIDWSPDYVYLKEFNGNIEKMNWFYENICTMDWNENQDAGYSMKKATEERIKMFPKYKKLIKMYYGRWDEMLKGSIKGSVDLLQRLVESKKYKIIALTNWSAETFPKALNKFEFLNLFEGIIVSGEEKTRKPFKKIYKIALKRYNLEAEKTLFIDDNLRNIIAANKLSIQTIHFKTPEKLENELKKLKLI